MWSNPHDPVLRKTPKVVPFLPKGYLFPFLNKFSQFGPHYTVLPNTPKEIPLHKQLLVSRLGGRNGRCPRLPYVQYHYGYTVLCIPNQHLVKYRPRWPYSTVRLHKTHHTRSQCPGLYCRLLWLAWAGCPERLTNPALRNCILSCLCYLTPEAG